jgi:hypothetical protein
MKWRLKSVHNNQRLISILLDMGFFCHKVHLYTCSVKATDKLYGQLKFEKWNVNKVS